MTSVESQLLYVIVWIAGSGVVAFLLAVVWRKILIPIAQKTRTSFDLMLLESADGRVQWLALAIGVYMGALSVFADVPGWRYCVAALYVHLIFTITCLVYSIAEGIVNWYAETFAEKTHSDIDDRAIVFFNRFAKILFFFIALTVVFQHFNIRIAGLMASAGIVSLAFAFAAKDTLANLISGVILMCDRPFKRGDRITLPSGGWGDVMEIGLRSTKVLSFEQKVIIIPNAEIAKSEIVNHSVPDLKIKVKHSVGVAYGSDMRKVKAIIQSILTSHLEILDDPPADVFFTAFGESSLDLTILFWLSNFRDRLRVLDDVNMAIKDKFEAESVEIPFPQRDIYIRAQAATSGGAPANGDA